MLVLFAAGAMSLLWMAGFSGLILGEKVWSKGEVLSKGIGVAGMAVGTISMTLAAGLFAG
jgi:predicted metal-binding membrane protein